MPLPYSGPKVEIRDRLGEAFTLDRLGSDDTGETQYRFNAQGYRGDDYDPAAPFKVFVFGESDAFGTGLGFDEIWTTRLARRLAGEFGGGEEALGLSNFADAGASNSFIVRTAWTQCGNVRPDFAIVQLADPRRSEGVFEDLAFHIGPWLREPHARRMIKRLPVTLPGRELLQEKLRTGFRRGLSYLDYATEEQGWMDSVRHLLSLQFFFAAHGIPAIAMSRQMQPLMGDGAGHPLLAPLVRMVDPAFYTVFRGLAPDEERASDGVHLGPTVHGRLAETAFEFVVANWTATDGGLVRRAVPEAKASHGRGQVSDTAEAVRQFYDELPFNYHASAEKAAASVRDNPVAATYPDLDGLLASGGVQRVTELGCGAGWLANSMALHYRVRVEAVDFSAAALRRARLVADALGVRDRVRFHCQDVLRDPLPADADLVVSVGVLHHTTDVRAAFQRAVRCVAKRGHLYVGLYHLPGRAPFLDYFRALVAESGAEAAFERYRRLDRVHAADETMARSWFRDQVLHPHETQHTLREVWEWLDAAGLELVSTSINRFEPLQEREQMFALEEQMAQVSERALHEENRYFPGFFTVLARRPG